MSTKIVLGHPEAHEKLTARLFYKRRAESGYIDAGNVNEFADATTRSLVTRARAADGARHVNDEQVDLNHEAFTFLLDEQDFEQQKLLRLGKALTDVTQTYAEGATATVTSAKNGRWHTLGVYNIGNVVVNASVSGLQEEGVDYEVDSNNGRIRVIPEAGISDGETLTVTFDKPALTIEAGESQYDPLFYCDFIIEEKNQFSKMWLRRHTFTGFLNVLEFPAQTGEFGVFRVKVTPSAPVTTYKRTEGQTLAEHGDQSEGPGFSSSSSSQSESSSS